MQSDANDILRRLPSIDSIVGTPRAKGLIKRHSRGFLVSALRRGIAQIRETIQKNPAAWRDKDRDAMIAATLDAAEKFLRPDLRPTINATGVIVHTNLGRAPLHREAIESVVRCASGYSNLEYDLEAGARGSRQSLIESKIRELTGAEAAIVVNNNAGAVMLALMALCHKREAIISRGELIEIGGSFRIPDVMKASGAIMVEVGTTNRTHLKDYNNSVTPKTSALLKVHRSNFFISGFTKEVSVAELATLANDKGLHLIVDLGSGVFVNTSSYGLYHEPTPAETLKQGAHVVTISGDKLLGGPQAGIIAGRKDLVAKMKSHPVHRALRPDKMTLAALEATLRLYMQGRESEIPVVAMLSAKPAAVKKKTDALAKRILAGLSDETKSEITVKAVKSIARVGGGAMAESEIPSYAVAISGKRIKPEKLMELLRNGDVPMIGRVENDVALFDTRTIPENLIEKAAEVVILMIMSKI